MWKRHLLVEKVVALGKIFSERCGKTTRKGPRNDLFSRDDPHLIISELEIFGRKMIIIDS